MRHGSLFSGIGGFDLAAEWMAWENVFHCEWMEFPRKVLDYHFPNADSHIDICKTDFTKYANTIDILTGGFPCQPFSLAGKRKGTDDERYLWGEMLRAIQEIKPRFVIAENVFGITNIDGGLVFQQVCLDLETEGYEVQPFIIPAAAKNAPHRRDRCWFIATNSNCNGFNQRNSNNEINTSQGGEYALGDIEQISLDSKCIGRTEIRDDNGEFEKTQQAECGEQQFSGANSTQSWWRDFPTQPPICGGDDGIPDKLDGITFPKWRAESIKGYGNAIVPQIAYQLFQIINDL
ncbi:Cytosine-specific methyltransferase [Gammaproteobacteria bacterium]